MWKAGVVLPALTICNINVVNYTKWQDIVEDPALEVELNNFLKNVNINSKSGWGLSSDEAEQAKYLDEISVNGKNLTILKDFHSKFYKFFLGNGEDHPFMKFANKWVDISEFSQSLYKLTELGECLVLNDDEVLTQTLGGKKGGLTLDLNTRIYEYLYATKSVGFMLYLRTPHEVLLTDNAGIFLPSGSEISVQLTRRNVKRLPSPYGTCKNTPSVFNGSVSLGVRECGQLQYMSRYLAFCGCLPWYFADTVKRHLTPEEFKEWLVTNGHSPDEYTFDGIDGKMCGIVKQVECDLKILDSLQDFNMNEICREPCIFSEWTSSVISAQFPATEGYFNDFLKDFVTIDDQFLENYDSPYKYAGRNFVRLHVYYDALKVTEVEQTKAYEVYNFIAQFGGTTDLFIGISFFTVFQLVEIIVAFVIFRCSAKKQTQTNINDENYVRNSLTFYGGKDNLPPVDS